MKSIFLVLLISICVVWKSTSQVHPFLIYTIKDNLISNEARTLFQDSHGFLWIGTSEGLSRFDGVSFTNYSPAEGLPHNYINHIIEDRNETGALWIATNGGGVVKFTQGRFKQFLIKSDHYANYVGYLMQDSLGVLWCATLSGIYTTRGDSLAKLHPNLNIHATGIYQTSDHRTTFFSGYKMYSYSSKDAGFTTLEISKDTNVLYIGSFRDSKKNIWAVLSNGDIIKILDDKIVSRFETGIKNSRFITGDLSHNVWVGTNNGMYKLALENGAKITQVKYGAAQGLPNSDLICGLVDRENNLWIGTYNEGIIKYEDQYVYKFPIKSLITPINNSQAVSDSAGHIWVATVSGLWEFWSEKKGAWNSYLHQVSHKSYPQSLSIDKRGKLWVGFAQSSIIVYEIRYRLGKSSELEVRSRIPLKYVPDKSDLLCMMLDSQNRLICSISNIGLQIIEFDSIMNKVSQQLITDNLPDVSVRAIYEDRVGNIWLGGYWGGLGIVEKGDWKNGKKLIIKESDGLPNNAVRTLCEDNDGNLLVGTRYSGIGIIPKERITSLFNQDINSEIFCRTITMRDGLASNAIWCLIKEDQTIFIGTNQGFQSMESEQLLKFRNYKESHGQRVALCGINKNGVTWYLTSDELVIDEDVRYRINLLPPKMLINSFTVDGVSISLDSVSSFSVDNKQFVIEYVGVSLRDGELMAYQYRLNNSKWSSWTRDRRITLAGLRPGSYTFDVQAINSDGFISEQSAQFMFTITTPLWQRWWFLLSAFLVMTIIFILTIRYISTQKLRRKLEIIKQEQTIQQERTQTRESISRDLHDEIASTLTGIGYFAQSIEKESAALIPQNSQKYLMLIKESSSEILESIRDIIWSLNPENTNWGVVLAKCRRYTSDLCESKSINYQIKFPEDMPESIPSLESMKNFWLIYKEIVTNAIRHSGCTKLIISINIDSGSSLLLEISDNGKGFDANKIIGNSGLSNIHSRTKKLNGNVELITLLEKGTSWKISLPI